MNSSRKTKSGLQDVDGDRSDWIEIYNPNPFGIDSRTGYRLRDSDNQLGFSAGCEHSGKRLPGDLCLGQESARIPRRSCTPISASRMAASISALVRIVG